MSTPSTASSSSKPQKVGVWLAVAAVTATVVTTIIRRGKGLNRQQQRLVEHTPATSTTASGSSDSKEMKQKSDGVIRGSSGYRTGLVWHERYMWHHCGTISNGVYQAGIDDEEQIYVMADQHFENADTKRRIHGLLAVCGALEKMYMIQPVAATKQQLMMFHTAGYVEKIESLNKHGGEAGRYAPFGKGSYDIACLSVGGVFEAVRAVVTGQVRNAYALVRPPGHHAERDRGMGFCLFSNVALAALYAQKELGIHRIAIVDWDVHHGNGSQQAFYNDDSVLFISVHQDGLYHAGSGHVYETGEGKGTGYTINIPLPPGTGDGGYADAFKRLINPAVDAFAPDLIIVSCGFDASAMDPLSQMMLSSAAYVQFTKWMIQLADRHCNGRLVVAHEGGYSATTVPYVGAAVIEVMMGESINVIDPYRAEIQGYPYQEAQAHQIAVVDAALAKAKEHGILFK